MRNRRVAHLHHAARVRLLVIGGTRFVGRHIAAAAIERGHAVTLFNRGLSAGPELFPEAEHVRGDRHAGGLAALAGRRFDAIVDSSAYFPADVVGRGRGGGRPLRLHLLRLGLPRAGLSLDSPQR